MHDCDELVCGVPLHIPFYIDLPPWCLLLQMLRKAETRSPAAPSFVGSLCQLPVIALL